MLHVRTTLPLRSGPRCSSRLEGEFPELLLVHGDLAELLGQDSELLIDRCEDHPPARGGIERVEHDPDVVQVWPRRQARDDG